MIYIISGRRGPAEDFVHGHGIPREEVRMISSAREMRGICEARYVRPPGWWMGMNGVDEDEITEMLAVMQWKPFWEDDTEGPANSRIMDLEKQVQLLQQQAYCTYSHVHGCVCTKCGWAGEED